MESILFQPLFRFQPSLFRFFFLGGGVCSLDVLSGSTPKTKSFSRHAVLDHEIFKKLFPSQKMSSR